MISRGLGLFACAIFFGFTNAVAANDMAKPDVLFLAVDDLNDWIGCLEGHPDVQTPHIDRLAKRGVLFSNAYCAAPACNPSRAALLTGIRPHSSGVYHNNQPWRKAMPDVVTLPQHFMKHGYRAVGGGKIYHGGFDDRASWNDYFHGRGNARKVAAKSSNGLNRGHFDWGPTTGTDEDMTDYHTVSWAIERLSEERDQPLFLAVGLHRPHLPWNVPQKYFDLYDANKIQLPKIDPQDLSDVPGAGVRMANPQGDHKAVLDADQWRPAVHAYLASISFADAQIGRLLDGLDKSPHAKETIIVFWGDHGWHLGEKQHWRKFALWEEATKAPLIVVAPGVTQASTRIERPVDFMTIYPTLAELCGLPIPAHVDGKSVLALLKDPNAESDQPAITTHGRGNHAVRMDQWRYIRYSDGSEELYDRARDPLEWKNLADDSQFAAAKHRLASHLPKQEAQDASRGKGGGERKKGRGKAKRAAVAE